MKAVREKRREIRDIFLKYHGAAPREAIGWGIMGVLTAGFAHTWLALIGGAVPAFVPVFILCGYGMAGMAAVGAAISSLTQTRKNDAGQSIRCQRIVRRTLNGMESDLRRAFKKAQRRPSSTRARQRFLSLAAEVKRDSATLSSRFNITAGPRTDAYVFVVSRKGEPPLTLDDAVRRLG